MISKKQAIIVGFVLLACCLGGQSFAVGDDTSPFKNLPGRWAGDGRVMIKDSTVELVKCRATYFLSVEATELKQNIRCASASGNKIEVTSEITHNAGQLSGTWNELIHNLGGDLRGVATPLGFFITVGGADLSAYMDVIVTENKQIVDVQFFNSALQSLTLSLQKG